MLLYWEMGYLGNIVWICNIIPKFAYKAMAFAMTKIISTRMKLFHQVAVGII